MQIIFGATAGRRGRLLLSSCRSLASLLAVALLLSVACGGPPVQTSAGTTVPGDVIITQDAVGDTLNALQEAHAASVAKHDATPICSAAVQAPCDTTEQHAARRQVLQRNAAGIRSGWRALRAWKTAGSEKPSPGIFCEVVRAAPDLLRVAVGFNAIKPEAAESTRKVIGVLGYGCPS